MDERYRPIHSRRGVLRGLGATLALPWLPSLAFAEGGGPAVAAGPPRRWATLLFANGVNVRHWWGRGDETGVGELSRSLQPIAPFRDDILFIENLHLFDDTKGVHTPYFSNFLCGETLGSGSIPNLATSVDQIMAKRIGSVTPVPSIVLGIEPASYGLAGGKPGVYNATISWSSPTTPVLPEVFPQRAFDRLFDTSSLMRQKSVLDLVLEQSHDIRGKLDTPDRHKLDEYMSSIRELERRIERATTEPAPDAWRPTLTEPNMERPADGRPGNTAEHMRLMLDILVLAFQMDKTRIATFLFEKDVTGMQFKFIEGVSSTGMHTISHHGKKPEMLVDYQKINQFHVEQLAYVLGKMKAVDEGGTSLLDNTMLLFGSTMMDGDTHDANQLPLMICGRGGGSIRPGRVLRYDKLEDRRLCNLHLAMAQKMGLGIDQVGNSHYALPGLG